MRTWCKIEIIKKTIAVGSDHIRFRMKNEIKDYFFQKGTRWMMAFDNMIDKIGMEQLDKLIKEGNAVENMALFRKTIFG